MSMYWQKWIVVFGKLWLTLAMFFQNTVTIVAIDNGIYHFA